MTSNIQTFSMEDVQKRVSDTIKAQFAMMIPDQVFDEMCAKAVREFVEVNSTMEIVKVHNNNYERTEQYRYQTAIPPFRILLWAEVSKLIRPKIAEWVEANKAEFEKQITDWFSNSSVAKDAFTFDVNTLALAMASYQQNNTMMTSMSVVQQIFNQIAYRMNSQPISDDDLDQAVSSITSGVHRNHPAKTEIDKI
jgi:hypothetical protein